MTIIDKLKLSTYTNMVVLNQPADYDVFNGYETTLTENHDAIFIFVETVDEMVSYTRQIRKEEKLLDKGYLYFAYPKKGNKRYDSFVHRDEIFPALQVAENGYLKNSDIKFSRMVRMDDVFTVIGLKREKTISKKSSAASQRVADYAMYVKDIEQLLKEHPKQLNFFKELTPGYQREWARYIFSAKQQKTRDKRQVQMVDLLAQGYKSVDLYRSQKK